MVSLRNATGIATSPKIYELDGCSDCWVAEATDGYFYMVPRQPGGWVQCDARQCDYFLGPREQLHPLPSQEARNAVWFVYGDVGSIVIAEG